MALTIMIVANEKTMTSLYASHFNKREFAIVTAHSGRQALAEAKTHRLDAVVVDTTSPRLNCKNLCRKLNNATYAPLVLIVSANAKVDGTIPFAGVIAKPVVAKKMVARVKSAIENKPPRLLTIGKLALDLEKHKVVRGSKSFPLTPKEFTLLKTLMAKPGQIISRKVLMKEVWETDYMGDTRTLDVHIRWVREKVEDNPSKPQRLVTVRGQGYAIQKEDE